MSIALLIVIIYLEIAINISHIYCISIIIIYLENAIKLSHVYYVFDHNYLSQNCNLT